MVSELNEIERAVTKASMLPEDLRAIYQELYDKSQDKDQDETNRRLVKLLLTWLLGQVKELNASELVLAVQGQPEYQPIRRQTVLDCCRGMVVYNHARDAFEFNHISVLEFLETEELSGYFKSNMVHKRLAEQCMGAACAIAMHSSGQHPDGTSISAFETYANNILKPNGPPPSKDSFLLYIGDFWAYHCGEADPEGIVPWKDYLRRDSFWFVYHSEVLPRLQGLAQTSMSRSVHAEPDSFVSLLSGVGLFLSILQEFLRPSIKMRLSLEAMSLNFREFHFLTACE